MADGASAIIGIVAFGLHAVHKVYEVVDSIKDAPADILALKHDAKQVGSLLLQLQQSGVLDSGVAPPSVDLAMLMKIFEDALSQVELFIDKVAEDRRDGEIRVWKLQWFLKNGRCNKLRESLASLKISIIAIVAAYTSKSIDAVQATVSRLADTQERLAEVQEHTYGLIDAFKRDHESWLASEVADLANFRAVVEERLTAIAYNQDEIFFRLASSPDFAKLPADSRQSHPRSIPESDVSASAHSMPRDQELNRIPVAPPRSMTTGNLKLPLQCEDPCECCCHDASLTRASPHWLAPLIGNLYLPRSFFHWSFSSCNVPTCRRTQRTRQIAKIKFFFPSWFIAVDMKIRLQTFPVHFCLQTPRRIPDTSPVFICIRGLDIEGTRRLLVSGEASVNDVDEHGFGVLHFAASQILYHPYEQVSEMLQFLVTAGAHTEWEEDVFRWTPLQVLQRHISNLRPHGSDSRGLASALQVHIAGPIFQEDAVDAWEDWLDRCNFPDVHRVVLTHRTRNMSLKDTLEAMSADINAPCQIGWTPLEWGIRISIPNIAEALLECGADVHKGCPLHRAVVRGDVAVLRALVHGGADVNQRDSYGRTALQIAAYRGRSRCVKELIRVGGDGLDWNAVNRYGRTAIDEVRRGRRSFIRRLGGRPTYGYDEALRALLDLQESRNGQRTSLNKPACRRLAIEGGLKMPGSFPTDWFKHSIRTGL